MKYQAIPNCNDCQPSAKCKGSFSFQNCKRHTPRVGGWTLAELALAHPDNLNKALRALPFETNLGFYLKS